MPNRTTRSIADRTADWPSPNQAGMVLKVLFDLRLRVVFVLRKSNSSYEFGGVDVPIYPQRRRRSRISIHVMVLRPN